jgi:hypothetical protein
VSSITAPVFPSTYFGCAVDVVTGAVAALTPDFYFSLPSISLLISLRVFTRRNPSDERVVSTLESCCRYIKRHRAFESSRPP